MATQLYTVPRIRMRGAISPLLHMPSVAWCLIMRGGGIVTSCCRYLPCEHSQGMGFMVDGICGVLNYTGIDFSSSTSVLMLFIIPSVTVYS